MVIKKNITIDLTEEDVKKIIVEHLTREGYDVSEDNITISVGTRLEGYGMAEHQVCCFNGVSIKCKEK